MERIAGGASFVARSFAGDRKPLAPLLRAALAHRGTAVLDVISPCVTFNDFDESTKSWAWSKSHEEPLQELGFVPHFQEIEVQQAEGEPTRVQMHDGSWITLRALRHDEHDVRDRASALRLLVEAQEANEFLTGLLYVDPDQPDFVAIQGMTDTPLSRLSDEDLRPSREVFEEILASI